MTSNRESNPEAEDLAAAFRPHVLLVEDHADMRAYLRKHLAPHYEVLEADRGDTGLELTRTEMPDVIVADIAMPGLDGYALCRALKSDPETDFLPVILLTARTDLPGRIEGLEGGADDYLTKPFEPAELLLRIRNILRTRARLKSRAGTPPLELPFSPARLPVTSHDSVLLKRLQEVLDRKSPDEEFGLAALATHLGMSRAQLHRRVTELCRMTPAELLMQFRLERAARALTEQAGTVGQVAYAVGFKNLSHFVKRFRTKYGETPAAYAAARRIPQPGAPRAE